MSRVAFARAAADQSAYRALLRIAVLAFLPAAAQNWASIDMLSAPSDPTGPTILAASMLSATLFAISRAWELVGMHDVGLLYSLQMLRNPESVAKTSDHRPEPGA